MSTSADPDKAFRSDPEGDGALRDASWDARLEGLVDSGLEGKKVAIVGCGSVGSYLAEELIRTGIRNIVLVDPDVVEWPNLTRTVFGYRDVGRPKVLALKDRLDTVFPDLSITTFHGRFQEISGSPEVNALKVDLFVSAVDDPGASGAINRICFELGVPGVFVGLYRAAKGGEVIFVDPAITPCLHCATGGVREALSGAVDTQAVERVRDYKTDRLAGEVALGSDIHFVAAAAVKIAISILSRDSPSALAGFIEPKLADGGHFLMLGMTPSYYIFPSTHGEALGQYAFQSVWVTTKRREDCHVCGAAS